MLVIYLPESLLNKLNFDVWCIIDSYSAFRQNRLLIDELFNLESFYDESIRRSRFQEVLEQMRELNITNVTKKEDLE